jgi:hypothetical protein
VIHLIDLIDPDGRRRELSQFWVNQIPKSDRRKICHCKMTLSYADASKNFQPLDLILFRGADFVSDTIRLFEDAVLKTGQFSHSGVLINSDILPSVPQLEPGRWYVWESTASATSGIMEKFTTPVPNALTGKGKFGVQIRDFEDVVTAYLQSSGAAVAWCPLQSNPWTRQPNETDVSYANRQKDLIQDIRDVFVEYGTRTYDANCLDLCASLFPCIRKSRDEFRTVLVNEHKIFSSVDLNIDPAGWVFCSELVTLIYQEVGVISSSINPLNVVPVDFLGAGNNGVPNLTQRIVYLQP